VQLVKGDVAIDGKRLTAGDAAAIEDAKEIAIIAETESELLLFDLA